jgi:hypothetical protein
MFDYPCSNCVIEFICSKECPAFNTEINRLMILGMEFQEHYSSYQGILRNVMGYMKGDLVMMLRTHAKARENPEFVELVHAFNKIYKQICRITINKNRKAGFKNDTSET